MNAGVLLVVWFDINYLAVRGQGKMDRYKAASSILKLCVIILSLSTVVGRPNGVDGGIHEAKKIPALLDRLRATAGNCRDAVNKLRIRVRNVSSLLILNLQCDGEAKSKAYVIEVGDTGFVWGLLGAALIADLLWASSSTSSSAYRYIASNWQQYPSIVVHNLNRSSIKVDSKDKKKNEVQGRVLSATFADLPAPQLQWEKMASSPVPRLDGAAIQIKNLLYVFAGYGTIDYVHSHVDIYNLTENTWGGRFDMPKEMAHSHLGMATDGRYVYVVNGQYGPQCRGPTAHTFVLDTETKQWKEMPSLPLPRYAPATQLWKGRLHVMGGSGVNRYTPEVEHWSLAVKDGKPLEKEWRSEIPIPRGGPHRACVVVGDRLMVIGGQEGDFMAKPGSPIFKCSRRNEVVYSDVYMLDNEMKWKTLPPMPKPDSHIEFAWTVVNNSIIIAGGTTEKHPQTKKMVLVGEVFRFDLSTERWSVIGKLPFRVKTTLVGFWDGWLYFTSGQRDRGPDDPSPRKFIAEMWRTKLKF